MKEISDKQRGGFGARLKRARDRAGYSQVEMSRAVGVSIGAYAGWEGGRIKQPSIKNLRKLVQVLNRGGRNDLTIAYLLDGAPDESRFDRLERELSELKEMLRNLADRDDQPH